VKLESEIVKGPELVESGMVFYFYFSHMLVLVRMEMALECSNPGCQLAATSEMI